MIQFFIRARSWKKATRLRRGEIWEVPQSCNLGKRGIHWFYDWSGKERRKSTSRCWRCWCLQALVLIILYLSLFEFLSQKCTAKNFQRPWNFLLFLLKGIMAYRNHHLPIFFSSCLKFAGFDVIRESIGVVKNGQKRFWGTWPLVWYFRLLKSSNFSKINLRNSHLKLRSIFLTLQVPYKRDYLLHISINFSWKLGEQPIKQEKMELTTGRNRSDGDFLVVVNHFDFIVVDASHDFRRQMKRLRSLTFPLSLIQHISRT